MYAHALYGAGMRNLKRPVDLLEKDLSSVATMVAGHKKLNTLFQVSVNDAFAMLAISPLPHARLNAALTWRAGPDGQPCCQEGRERPLLP